jgi:hypothetical protein
MHSPPAKLGRTPVRASSLAFGHDTITVGAWSSNDARRVEACVCVIQWGYCISLSNIHVKAGTPWPVFRALHPISQVSQVYVFNSYNVHSFFVSFSWNEECCNYFNFLWSMHKPRFLLNCNIVLLLIYHFILFLIKERHGENIEE